MENGQSFGAHVTEPGEGHLPSVEAEGGLRDIKLHYTHVFFKSFPFIFF